MRPRQTITHLKADLLTQHPDNIRDDLGDLTDLALSIREHGILQPITVTEHRLGGFLILAGHRRFNAGTQAGLTTFPVVIRHGLDDPAEQTILMLVENTQRRDLDPIEKAHAFAALLNRGLTQQEVARRVGVHPSTVSYYLPLLDLDDESIADLRAGRFSTRDARQIVTEVRQERRVSKGGARWGRPKGAATEPYFGRRHRLAKQVKASCAHRTRKTVGNVGCGPCWEQAIREDATEPTPEEHYDIDNVLVRRVIDGDRRLAREANPAERRAVATKWAASGRPLSELARMTGWKIERSLRIADEMSAS